ncbi:MAG: aspartate aminotransferase family protein [bacterium]
MKIPEKGKTKGEILKTLHSYKEKDLDWRSGKVMGYIYHPGDEAMDVINEAYTMYLTENALDPTAYPSIFRIENELIGMLADLLRGDENMVGNFTSGGTESIMMAVLSARNKTRAERPEIKEPEIILPLTAHAAFYKACHYLGVKPVAVPVRDETFRADVDAMRNAITENTILLVCSAPGYAHGVVDPVEEIAQLAQEKNLLCHVDACVGGIHLSFMRKLDMDVPAFDLSVPGVTSLSVDMHKYGYAAKNASVILYKSKDLRRRQIFACASWPGYTVVNATAGSSKTGGPVAGAWAILNHLGSEGYMEIVREVMDATRLLIDGIGGIDCLKVNGSPDMCMFSFHSTTDRLNVYKLADEMKLRGGWYLQPQFARGNSKSNLHIAMTHLNVPMAEALLKDLKETVNDLLKEEKPAEEPSQLAATMQNLDFNNLDLDEGALLGMLEMAGVTKDSTPERMEEINKILESLPYDFTEFILITYFNNMMKAG